jgi:acetoin utilization deacetylase AcuC-like enzyme
MSRKRVGYSSSDVFLQHVPPAGHPERPDRLRRLNGHLLECGLRQQLVDLKTSPASPEQLLAVHTQRHVDFVRETCEGGGGPLDEGDTYAVRESFGAATLAAGAVLGAIGAVVGGSVDSTFCAVRPPGHHAERDRPMGFCLFNNVAIGARLAQAVHGVRNIAILDWDVHHGNGTQHIFDEDSTVLYVSLHQYPFYPGTGARDERGSGQGEGYTVNIPLPAGSGEHDYLAAFDETVLPSLLSFKPELLIISAGFDAHRSDPLGGMVLTEESFATMTEKVMNIAPIVSVLEGGYHLDALARSVEAHVRVLLG